MTEHLRWSPPPAPHRVAVLSPRQADVLTGLCYGLTNAAIGSRLHLSEDTVKTHVKGLLQALGARNRCHAVALATAEHATVLVRAGSAYEREVDAAMRRHPAGSNLRGGAAWPA